MEEKVLRVLVLPEGSRLVGQGVEIEYVISGETFEDLQKRFLDGLKATVEANIRAGGLSILLEEQKIDDLPHKFRSIASKDRKFFDITEVNLKERYPSAVWTSDEVTFPYMTVEFWELRAVH